MERNLVIYETTDYDMFGFSPSNRPIKEKKVLELIESIKTIGYQKCCPIHVDENKVIIDGQHRHAACKRMKTPLLYTVEESTSDTNLVRTMLNANQSKWELWDYVVSSAKEGKQCYQELVNFKEKHGLLNTNCIAILCASSNMSSKIRKGIDFIPNPNAEQIVDFLNWAKQFVDYAFDKHFILAVRTVYANVDKDMIMFLKDEQKMVALVSRQATIESYLRCFENIINIKIKNKSKKVKLV